MDVLFNSINVRDLLSSHDLDESSPLSAPDLRLLIDRLQFQSLQIKSKVQAYLLSHHADFSELFSRCSESASRCEQISDSVSNLLALISDHPIDAEIRVAVSEIEKTMKELKAKRELLDLVKVIVELSERLKSVQEDLKNGRLISAAEAVRDLKKAVGTVAEEREPVVYGLLRKEWAECFEEVRYCHMFG